MEEGNTRQTRPPHAFTSQIITSITHPNSSPTHTAYPTCISPSLARSPSPSPPPLPPPPPVYAPPRRPRSRRSPSRSAAAPGTPARVRAHAGLWVSKGEKGTNACACTCARRQGRPGSRTSSHTVRQMEGRQQRPPPLCALHPRLRTRYPPSPLAFLNTHIHPHPHTRTSTPLHEHTHHTYTHIHTHYTRSPRRRPHLVDGDARLVVVHAAQHQVHAGGGGGGAGGVVGPQQAGLEGVKAL